MSRLTGGIYPVILSGGSGTRLWPLSRAMYPKQFIRFFNGQGSSFLGATLQRARRRRLRRADHRLQQRPPLPGQGGGRARRHDAAGDHPRAGRAQHRAGGRRRRAAGRARRPEPASWSVMPSDHVIKDEPAFVAAVRRAAERGGNRQARAVRHRADGPHTGYGYIRRGAALAGFDGGAIAVDAFFEKPDQATAADLRRRRRATSGTAASSCCTRAPSWTSSARLAPRDPGGGARRPSPKRRRTSASCASTRAAFAQCAQHLHRLRGDGEDRAGGDDAHRRRLERRRLVVVAVGDRAARRRTATPSTATPSSSTRSNCYVHTERSLVATIGVKDLVIVDTPDALLVADQRRAQDVSGIVARLKEPTARSTRSTSATTGRGAFSRR